jgi:uncharacterized membrane protein
MKSNNSVDTKRLTLMAVLTAIVAILAYLGGFIKIGGLASISLTLIPVVIGSALCGPFAGAWLGFISGVVFFATADAGFWLSISIPGTIIIVLIKGILAGFFAGLAYKLLEKVNRYLAVIVSAIVCPVVNTGIFLLGCRMFFWDTVLAGAQGEGMGAIGYLIVFFVGLNFILELLVNMILSPTILKIINIRKKEN